MDNGSKPFDAHEYLINLEKNPNRPDRLYLQAKHRVMWLRHQVSDESLNHEFGIETEELEHDREAGYIRMKATIRCRKDGFVLAQATKTETRENFKDYVEKCETSAVGRALAFAGYGTQFAIELDGEGEADRPVDAPMQDAKTSSPPPQKVQRGQLQLMSEMIAQHGLTKEFCKERWGDASTFSFEQAGDELYASGDWEHLPDKNIWHNIEILRLIIATKRRKKGYLCNYEPEAIIEVTDVKLIRRQKEAQESSIFIWDSNLMEWELET